MSRSCYNKTYAEGYWTSERVFEECNGVMAVKLVPKWIPHTMTKDCRYDRMATDPECVRDGKDCKWKTNS